MLIIIIIIMENKKACDSLSSVLSMERPHCLSSSPSSSWKKQRLVTHWLGSCRWSGTHPPPPPPLSSSSSSSWKTQRLVTHWSGSCRWSNPPPPIPPLIIIIIIIIVENRKACDSLAQVLSMEQPPCLSPPSSSLSSSPSSSSSPPPPPPSSSSWKTQRLVTHWPGSCRWSDPPACRESPGWWRSPLPGSWGVLHPPSLSPSPPPAPPSSPAFCLRSLQGDDVVGSR